MPEPIRTLFKPSLADFCEATGQYRAPVKITGEVNEWPAFRDWSITGMAERFGDVPVKVMRLGVDGVARLDPESGFEGIYQATGLRAFAEEVAALSPLHGRSALLEPVAARSAIHRAPR